MSTTSYETEETENIILELREEAYRIGNKELMSDFSINDIVNKHTVNTKDDQLKDDLNHIAREQWCILVDEHYHKERASKQCIYCRLGHDEDTIVARFEGILGFCDDR